jgi:DNA-binding MarR family transcriptional regulator
MATADEEAAIPADIMQSIELLMFEAIGMTTVALANASTGELTLAQWRALVVIGRTDELRVGDIASAVGMSLPSTSRLVQRLERRQLVTTARDETDRRATLVSLTARGHELRERVVACRRELMEQALTARAGTLPRALPAGLRALATAFDRYA